MNPAHHRPHRPCHWLLSAFLGIGILAGGVGYYFWTWQPDPRLYPVRGIDVSHHQVAIDWPAVARDGISFAYLKASEGGDYVDPAFAASRQAAAQAGLKVGAYHFFTLCRPGADQARHFLAVLREDGQGLPLPAMLPPVVDLEFGGNCGSRPSPAELRVELDAFIALVESGPGQPVLIYTTDEFDAAYGAALPARPRWRRSLFRMPTAPDWVFWQYHDAGHVAGISGRVDLDVFCGDATAWRQVSDIAGFACSAGR